MAERVRLDRRGQVAPEDRGSLPRSPRPARPPPTAGFPETENRMDLVGLEHDRPFVLEALRGGEIDYLEYVGEAVEADFFRHLIDRQVLQRLADEYPTPRKKRGSARLAHLGNSRFDILRR